MALLTWMDIETIMQNEVSRKREKQKSYINTHVGSRVMVQTNQSKSRNEADIENKHGYQGRWGDGLMDWKIPMDKHTLLCIE